MTNPTSTLERIWVSLLDSRMFRRFARHGIGLKLFRSQPYFQLRLLKDRFSTTFACTRQPDLFQDVTTFCMFIGHNKSGTSMLGALLDAHPEVILSDEVGALHYLAAGFHREQIFHLLLKGSRREALKGRITARRLTPYSYHVPGQWQGKYTHLRVIGDGKAGSTTQLFARNPALLPHLRAEMTGLNLRFIQSVRNPFDPISIMMVRGKRSFDNSIAHYFAACDALVRLRQQIGAGNLLPIRYEDFVRRPDEHMQRLCAFIGVEPYPDYMKACLGILYSQPDQHRQRVPWQAGWIEQVESKIAAYDFLQGYSFKD